MSNLIQIPIISYSCDSSFDNFWTKTNLGVTEPRGVFIYEMREFQRRYEGGPGKWDDITLKNHGVQFTPRFAHCVQNHQVVKSEPDRCGGLGSLHEMAFKRQETSSVQRITKQQSLTCVIPWTYRAQSKSAPLGCPDGRESAKSRINPCRQRCNIC